MKIEKIVKPNVYLDKLTRILTAQEDDDVLMEIECLVDLADGEAEEHIDDIRSMLLTAGHIRLRELEEEWLKMKLLYPEPPKPECANFIGMPSDIFFIPEKSGVYFFWDTYYDDKIIYIGKSKNLKKRLIKHHDKIDPDCAPLVSFLLFPEAEISYIEAYYIGVYRPRDNFPSSHVHVK